MLRDEKILVERRPVNRVASAADFNMGQGSAIELNATGEEAVVGKTARVVEEVLVGKESTSRTEVIHDSVRKTEVEVEQIAGATTTDEGPLVVPLAPNQQAGNCLSACFLFGAL